jgi:hypothetical protein
MALAVHLGPSPRSPPPQNDQLVTTILSGDCRLMLSVAFAQLAMVWVAVFSVGTIPSPPIIHSAAVGLSQENRVRCSGHCDEDVLTRASRYKH